MRSPSEASRENGHALHDDRYSKTPPSTNLLRAFWNGEFEHSAQPDGGVESLVFTLEVPKGTSPDHPYSVTQDGHVLKRVVDEITGRARDVATSERQPLFWTRREFFRFIARFWNSNESASTGLANFGTANEAFHFMAACSVEDYPTTQRALVERLHISRAALEGAKRGALRNHAKRQPRQREKAGSPAKAGAPEKPIWRQIYPHVLAWLDDEGEPDTRAEVERYMAGLLVKTRRTRGEIDLARARASLHRATSQTASAR